MKRTIISIARMTVALASCTKSESIGELLNNQENSEKVPVTIRFSSPSTKSLTQSQEDQINSLAVALYMTKGGNTTLEGYYTFSPAAGEGNIYIDASKDPDKYIIAAYANHPTMSLATHTDDWSLFKDEGSGKFQMFCKWEGSEAELLASPVDIQLKRQCSKVTLNKISVDWVNPANAAKEFYIKGIYLMDVEGVSENLYTYSGSQDWYNKNGYVSCAQDALLYAQVANVSVTGAAPYTTSHDFYGYISDLTNFNTSASWTPGASRLVINASFDGRNCYYAVKINRNNLTRIRNTHFVFNNIKITKPGADYPYSGLIDETAISVDFTVKPWDTQSFNDIVVE